MVGLVFEPRAEWTLWRRKGRVMGEGKWLSITLSSGSCRVGQGDTGGAASDTHGCHVDVYPKLGSVERLTDYQERQPWLTCRPAGHRVIMRGGTPVSRLPYMPKG